MLKIHLSSGRETSQPHKVSYRGGLKMTKMINPHQRCGDSDSQFARILSYAAEPRNWVEGVDTASHTHNIKANQ